MWFLMVNRLANICGGCRISQTEGRYSVSLARLVEAGGRITLEDVSFSNINTIFPSLKYENSL